jgi:hypothetical protein
MARGPYAAYEWANCMHDVHSPPPPPVHLAMREAPPPAPPRPRAAMQGIAQDVTPPVAQPQAPPAAAPTPASTLADAGVVGAIRDAVGTAVEERVRVVTDAQRRERDSYADHLATLSCACNRVIENSQTFPGELAHVRNPPGALGIPPPPPPRGAAMAAMMPHPTRGCYHAPRSHDSPGAPVNATGRGGDHYR